MSFINVVKKEIVKKMGCLLTVGFLFQFLLLGISSSGLVKLIKPNIITNTLACSFR